MCVNKCTKIQVTHFFRSYSEEVRNSEVKHRDRIISLTLL